MQVSNGMRGAWMIWLAAAITNVLSLYNNCMNAELTDTSENMIYMASRSSVAFSLEGLYTIDL